jgi:hypothetical protein
MLFSHWYTSPTSSVKGAGNTSRSAAATTTFWLALVKVGSYCTTCSFAMAYHACNAYSCLSQLANLASTATHSPVSLPRCYAILCLVSTCGVRCHLSG